MKKILIAFVAMLSIHAYALDDIGLIVDDSPFELTGDEMGCSFGDIVCDFSPFNISIQLEVTEDESGLFHCDWSCSVHVDIGRNEIIIRDASDNSRIAVNLDECIGCVVTRFGTRTIQVSPPMPNDPSIWDSIRGIFGGF